MAHKSQFPPLPPIPDVNYYNVMFGRPDQAEWPDYVMQIDDRSGRKRMFREVPSLVARAATALGGPVTQGGLGLQAGTEEIVGILGNNSIEYFDLVTGLLSITVPFALISSYSTRRELVHALKLTKATCLFVDAKLLPNVLSAIQDPEVNLRADNIYILSGTPPKGRKSLTSLIDGVVRKKTPVVGVRPAKKDTLAYLVMSSGTSGLPKAVMISHGNLYASAMQALVMGPVLEPFLPPKQPGDHITTLAALPMFHTYGLHVYVFRATLVPITFIVLEKWNTTKYLAAIPKYKVTHLSLVPSLIHQMVQHPDFHKTDFSTIKHAISGAAYLPPALGERLRKTLGSRVSLQQGYGLSESTLGGTAFLPPGAFGYEGTPVGSQGILLPGLEARIVREDGKTDAAIDEVGELWLQGPTICMGYWNNPAANAGTWAGGWLRTGDQFRINKNGFLFYADRGKDTLKVSGVQVSPKEIEDVLLAHPEKLITDVSVAGVSGGRDHDEKVPRAWIVLSPAGKKKGPEATMKALLKWHEGQLSRYKWLRGGIEVVKTIPKTPTGKTLRRTLQEEYERKVKSKAKL